MWDLGVTAPPGMRGGPLGGDQRHIRSRTPIGIEAGPDGAIHPPTAEHDSQYPTLAVRAFDHSETEAG